MLHRNTGGMMRYLSLLTIYLIGISLYLPESFGQTNEYFDPSSYKAFTYRKIGPFRGGRSAAVTGVPGRPMMCYFSGADRRVWKSKTGGQQWDNISDGFFPGLLGRFQLVFEIPM